MKMFMGQGLSLSQSLFCLTLARHYASLSLSPHTRCRSHSLCLWLDLCHRDLHQDRHWDRRWSRRWDRRWNHLRWNNYWFARDALEHGLAQRRVCRRCGRAARQQRADGAGRALVGGGERARTQGERVRGTKRR
jgi:hypothetical protein